MDVTALRPQSRFRARHSVEELQARLDALTLERQRLRAGGMHDDLEHNRLEIARAQWELSYALIDRHLPAA